MGLTIALLIILFFERWKSKGAMAVVAALLAAQAITDEIWFVFFLTAFALICIMRLIQSGKESRRDIWISLVLLALAPGLVALFQGGVLTGAASGIFSRLSGGAPAAQNQYFSLGFHLRFPPAFVSAHLGTLALTNWAQTLTAIAEVGPIFLLLPLFLIWGRKGYRAKRTIFPILALGAAASFLTIFIGYEGAAGISASKRLTLYSSVLLTLFAVPLLWYWLRRRKQCVRYLAISLLALCMVGGVVYFAVESAAAQVPGELLPGQVGCSVLSKMSGTLCHRKLWCLTSSHHARLRCLRVLCVPTKAGTRNCPNTAPSPAVWTPGNSSSGLRIHLSGQRRTG